MFSLLCTSFLPYCWLCSITSAAQGTVTRLNAQVAKGLCCVKPVSCWWAASFPLTSEASACWQLELVEVWKVSRAGLKEVRNWRSMQLLTSGAFHSTELHWPLRAVWNLVFILFWQRQQHLELFEHPFFQLHLNVFLTQESPGIHQPLLQPLSCASLPSPQLPAYEGPTLIQPSCVTLLRVLEKKLWESLER